MLRVEASEGSVLSSSNAAPGWSKEGLGLGRYSNPPSKGNLPPHINVPRKHEVEAQPELKTRVSMLIESCPPPPHTDTVESPSNGRPSTTDRMFCPDRKPINLP